MANIVSLKNLTKVYKTKKINFNKKESSESPKKGAIIAVDDVTLDVIEGEIFGIIGSNGAGKTTIIKTLCGLIMPTRGTASVCGCDLQTQKVQALTNIGAVIEEPTLYKEMNAEENLKYFGLLQGGVSKKRIDDVLKIVGLEDRKKSKFSTYSLGMKQRLGIAQAIMHNPKLLILDEPINGLDPTAIIEVRNLLKTLAKEYGVTIIISSHILSEMQELCDRVAIMSKGKVITLKTVEELANGTEEHSIISIMCNDLLRAEELLKEKFDCQTKISDNKLFIKIIIDDVAIINKFLIMNDIMVTSINIKKKTLEEVYKEMMK